jgi:hypothetical protein
VTRRICIESAIEFRPGPLQHVQSEGTDSFHNPGPEVSHFSGVNSVLHVAPHKEMEANPLYHLVLSNGREMLHSELAACLALSCLGCRCSSMSTYELPVTVFSAKKNGPMIMLQGASSL